MEGSLITAANGLQVIKKHSKIVGWWCVAAVGITML
jgi:hypothetical protein